jgi:hypothetical protein
MIAGGFAAVGENMVMRLSAALDAFGEIIMDSSLEQCPVETGTLKRSARVGALGTRTVRGGGGKFVGATSYADAGEDIVIIGYGFGDEINPKTRRPASDYAVPVHEIIEAYHKPPTKAKFLEDPVYEHSSEMEPFLASWLNIESELTPVLGAFIAAAAGAGDIEANVGAHFNDLDAGDHPKGTPHV